MQVAMKLNVIPVDDISGARVGCSKYVLSSKWNIAVC